MEIELQPANSSEMLARKRAPEFVEQVLGLLALAGAVKEDGELERGFDQHRVERSRG